MKKNSSSTRIRTGDLSVPISVRYSILNACAEHSSLSEAQTFSGTQQRRDAIFDVRLRGH